MSRPPLHCHGATVTGQPQPGGNLLRHGLAAAVAGPAVYCKRDPYRHTFNSARAPNEALWTYSSADERAFTPMHEPAVVCMVSRAGRGVERAQLTQADFPAGRAAALPRGCSRWRTSAGIFIRRDLRDSSVAAPVRCSRMATDGLACCRGSR